MLREFVAGVYERVNVANDRVIFLDNIRSLMIILVLVLHASAAYSRFVPWWYVADQAKNPLFDITVTVLDIFLMPVLFFISGYFALPSLNRRETFDFIIAKFRRLGIPLALIGVFIAPIMPYIRYHARADQLVGYLEYWLEQLKTFPDLRPLHVSPVEMATTTGYQDLFIQHHLWFLSLLLVFFMLFAAGASVKRKFAVSTDNVHSGAVPTVISMLGAMLFSGLAASLFFALINLSSRDGSWIRIGGLLLFQPTRVPLYAGLFCLGIHAYSRNWFVRRKLPGATWTWLAASLGLLLAFLTASGAFYDQTAPNTLYLALSHGLLRTFLCLSLIGFFTSLAYSCCNSPTRINRSLAASSYDIYLVHLPIVVLIQLAMFFLNISPLFKFGVVCLMSLIISWGMSSFMIRQYPRVAVAALLAVFSAAVIFVL